MGAEWLCDGVVDGKVARGKARLETATLEFRAADVKAVVRFDEITSIKIKGERLVVCAGTRAIELALGAKMAAKWLEKIRHPPSRLQKIGVKPGQRVVLLGDVDESFADELLAIAPDTSRRRRSNADVVFLFAKSAADLEKVSAIVEWLAPAGALWLVRRKGDANISENAVMRAGRAAGLVDVKVVGFSAERSALKFVIPKSKRV